MGDRARRLFGVNVKEQREKLKLSLEEFEERTGFTRLYLLRVERGKVAVSLDKIAVIAEALDTQMHELLQPRHSESKNRHGCGSCEENI